MATHEFLSVYATHRIKILPYHPPAPKLKNKKPKCGVGVTQENLQLATIQMLQLQTLVQDHIPHLEHENQIKDEEIKKLKDLIELKDEELKKLR